MKSVSVSKTLEELLEDLFRSSGENKQQVKDRILARLQRKNNNLTPEQKYEVTERLGGIDLKAYVHKLKSYTEDAFIEVCKKDKDFLQWVDSLKCKKKGYFYSEKEDTLKETTRGYGNTKKPEDYLDAFTKYVNEKKTRLKLSELPALNPVI